MVQIGQTTFGRMVQEVGELVHDQSSGREGVIQRAINRLYDGIAQVQEWPQLVSVDTSGLRTLGDTEVASLEQDEPETPAPFDTGKIRSMTYQDMGGRIEVVSAAEFFDRAGSNLERTGRPQFAAQVGVTAQTLRLEEAGALSLYNVDTDTMDNAAAIYLDLRPADAPLAEDVQIKLTGDFSNGVPVGPDVAEGYPIRSVLLPVNWAGGIEIRDGDGNAIVKIVSEIYPPTEPVTKRRPINRPLYRFWPTPDQDYALTWTWWRRIREMHLDQDFPEIPVSTYLVHAAAATIFRQQDEMGRAREEERAAAQALKLVMRQQNPGSVQQRPTFGNFLSQTGI